ncbi:hypothetical protein CEXT_673381 [Caerostris extrusa]|uniref:Secreted protein n=1 Tax=Caerostris extrusa TaxID=172846 RepID=A0AAV4XKJ5_CAEEX|nr:hypothetical protein CEXT_673381 [Caerostris extrusa]
MTTIPVVCLGFLFLLSFPSTILSEGSDRITFLSFLYIIWNQNLASRSHFFQGGLKFSWDFPGMCLLGYRFAFVVIRRCFVKCQRQVPLAKHVKENNNKKNVFFPS